jgi:ubiquinone biosynthesis protein
MKQESACVRDDGDKEPRTYSLADHLTRPSWSHLRAAVLLQMPSADRTNALTAMLQSPAGSEVRQEASWWISQALSVKRLVPEVYAEWRPLVRDAMVFFGSHLSTSRLAPKLVEQIELPLDTTPEKRLLRLIARVPGLQKLGQVIARNRHLHRSLRRELTQLENGISDVTAEEIRTVIVQNLGSRLQRYAVEIEPKIFCEASVSAVVRFTWYNPEQRRRERGVFKVMKPYVPAYFGEDMELLARLAEHLGARHHEYGFAKHALPDTFDDVHRLLKHEVEFGREQANLRRAASIYGPEKSIHIPRVIRPLCAPTITALTEEDGQKITTAVAGLPNWHRARVADLLIEAAVAVPLLTPGRNSMFHADPHAGNLLYNKRTGVLTLLDWALTSHLTEEQRRQFSMLFLMILLRDAGRVSKVIEALSLRERKRSSRQKLIIREEVTRFFDRQPLARIPRAVDVIDLLERIAWQGVRLPSHLVMLRKVLFTLDGILHDIGGPRASLEFVIVRCLLRTWLKNPAEIGWPLLPHDWLTVYWSAIFYGSRLAIRGLGQFAPYGCSEVVWPAR